MIELLDLSGSVLAFTSTVFYVRINPLAWPVGLLAILIDISLYFKKGLFGDTCLNGVYFILTLYGWYRWKFGGKSRSELPISSINKKLALKLLLIASIGIYAAFFILSRYTNSKVPLWDATTTILSLIAEWMICNKIIQNWILWFLVDSMYVGLYFYKGIPIHGTLNIIYLFMAVSGYLKWKKEMNSYKIKPI